MHEQVLDKLALERFERDRPEIWHLPDHKRDGEWTLCGIQVEKDGWGHKKGKPTEKCVVCLDLAPDE